MGKVAIAKVNEHACDSYNSSEEKPWMCPTLAARMSPLKSSTTKFMAFPLLKSDAPNANYLTLMT